MFTDQLGTSESQLGNLMLAKFYAPPTYDQDVNQSLSLTQQAIAGAVFNRSVSHTLTLTQNAQHPIDEHVTSTLTLTQSVEVVRAHISTLTSNLTLSQSVSHNSNFTRSVNQGLALTHAATKTIQRLANVNQTLNLTHSAVGVASKHTSSVLVLTHQADFEYVYGARSFVELTQTVDVSITVTKKAFSNLGIYHSVSYNGQFNKTVNQSLTLTQTVSYQLVKFASNHLNLMQTVDYTLSKGLNDVLTLTQLASVSKTTNKRLIQTLIDLRHSVAVTKVKALSVHSALGLSHHAKATRVIHVSASNFLNLSQDLVRERFLEDVTQPLTLTQTAVGHKVAPRAVSQSLNLTQTVTVSKTYVRHVQHTLVFNPSFQKYTGIIEFPFVDVPTAQGVLVRKVTILQQGSSVIVLPSAEFGDSDSNPSKINVKRAMNGTKRIYKRKTPTNKLSYTFVLDRVKAIELRSFIMANNTKMIRMENWKGELWSVLMTNNPFAFSEDSYWASSWGNKCSITLEFEGVRLN